MRYKLVSVSRSPQTTPDTNGFFEALVPATWWAGIEPLEASVNGDGDRIQAYRVKGRYHSGITVDTRLLMSDGRELFVKGVQNVGEMNAELILYCEQVVR